MKKIFVITLLFALLFNTSCGLIELDKDLVSEGQIDKLDYCPGDIISTVPSELSDNITKQLSSVLSDIFDDIVVEVKKQGTWPASEVTLKELSLEQTDVPDTLSSSNSLGFISEMELYISFQDSSDEILLGSTENSDENAIKLIFDLENKNIVKYIDKGFNIRIELSLRNCPAEDIKFKTKTKAHIVI